MIAKGLIQLGEMNRDVEEALDEHGQAMVRILEEADQLRLSTVKELVNILTPLQAVDFLVAKRQLRPSSFLVPRKKRPTSSNETLLNLNAKAKSDNEYTAEASCPFE
ncbi:PREDICTED: mRNAion factor, partial [Prunus dulcis]